MAVQPQGCVPALYRRRASADTEHGVDSRFDDVWRDAQILGHAGRQDARFWTSQFLITLMQYLTRTPASDLQGLLMIDEADIYMPAVGKPATKQPLIDLLKRARSAGVGGDPSAGRNAEKLNQLKEELRSDPQILLADVDDRHSLVRLAALAKAVGTTVGPYARYGTELVSACVEVGTHYCDLRGEIPWIRSSIDAFDAAAHVKKVRIVHCCGYDSIPFDIPVYLMQRLAHEEFGAPLTKIHTGLTGAKGGVSGGTVHSLLELLDDASENDEVARLLKDPLALVPDAEHAGRPHEVQMSPRYRPPFGWTAPHLMAPINSRVVRRSQSLLRDLYPPALEYDEFIAFGEGFAGWAKAQVIAGFFGLFLGALAVGQVRHFLVRRMLPKPGGGPSRKTRETGYFAIRSLGEGKQGGGDPFRIAAQVNGQGDPGYDATARMLGTSLLCLAQDKLEHPRRYGVLTPASCFGDVIARELERHAISFQVHALPPAGEAP